MQAVSERLEYSLNGALRVERRRWDHRITMLAAVLALVVFGVAVTVMYQTGRDHNPSLVAISSPTTAPHPVISPDNAAQLELLETLGSGYVGDVEWSPDGSLLALSGSLGVWLYHPDDLNTPITLLTTDSSFISSVIFSRDGSRLAFADTEGIHLWDLTDLTELDAPQMDSQTYPSVMAFNPDGLLLASADYQGAIRIWDLASGEMITEYNPFYSYTPIFDLSFSPDGTRLAFAGSDTPVLVLDDPTGEWRGYSGDPAVLRPGVRSEVGTRSVRFSPDGRLLGARVGNKIVIWNAATGEQVNMLDTFGPVEGQESTTDIGAAVKGGGGDLTFSPDGSELATVDETIRVWTLATGQARLIAESSNNYAVGSAAFSPDWTRLAMVSPDSILHIVDLESGDTIASSDAHDVQSIGSVAVRPDGEQIAGLSSDNTIRLWSLEDSSAAPLVLKSQAAPFPGQARLAYSPDGQQLALRTFDGISLWNAQSGSFLRDIPVASDASMYIGLSGFTSYSPNGSLIATTTLAGAQIVVFDAARGDVAHTYSFDEMVADAVFTPDGRALVVALSPFPMTFGGPADSVGGFSIRVIDAGTGETMMTLDGHHEVIRRLAISPDGTLLASVSNDGDARLWDLTAGTLVRSLSESMTATGALAFSRDGQIVAVSDSQGTGQNVIRLWDVETGEALGSLDETIPSDMAFTPDGTRLVVGGGEGVVHVWGIGLP